MKRISKILLTVILATVMVLSTAGVVLADKTIHVKQSTLDAHQTCSPITYWHFVITQISSEAVAPALIHVYWNNGAEADVTRLKFTGGVAHYYTPANAGFLVTDATAVIYDTWKGQFNLSHTSCDGDGDGSEQDLPVLEVLKFYDANANGVWDTGEVEIAGWKVSIDGNPEYTPFGEAVAVGSHTVVEFMPIETCWMATTPTSVTFNVSLNETKRIEFGNLCLGSGGGLTLGFWSNKNGQALFGSDDLAAMVALNLRNADGSNFDPASYAAFRTWLLNANATNMAYMLSAQLAAMKLNVFNGKVAGTAIIYAPGTTSANALGFATVNAIIAEADAELGLHGLTLADSPYRAYQEALKNTLDKANNNLTFVQPTPCPFTFAP